MDNTENFGNNESNIPLRCSFCRKTQNQVKKIIAGPDVYICDECVELCNEILFEESEYSEAHWIKQFEQYEREFIQIFIDSNIKQTIYPANILESMTKLKITNKYKYEWNVLNEHEEFHCKYDTQKAIKYFEKAIKIRRDSYLPYILFILKNWQSEENVWKSLEYCMHIRKIANKNKDYELIYRIDKFINGYKNRLDNFNTMQHNNDLKKEEQQSAKNKTNDTKLQTLHLIIEQILVKFGNCMNINDLEEIINSECNFVDEQGRKKWINSADIQMEIYAHPYKLEREDDLIYLKY